MGITGLLPFIKNSCRSANLGDFRGATVAIDAYSWLHKGAFSCAEKLVKGEKTDGYVFYCAKLLNMLLDLGVKPIMVFDGCNLPSKLTTEKKRRENREKTRQRGKELLCEGKVKEARECFQRCVDVTPEMAREVIKMCRKKSVDCIVAPYEADAQLAYLDKIGMAQIIITEDSDLTLFGCSKIFFKMDSFGGGLLYEKENLPKSFGANASRFSFEKFQHLCILSGCDYLPSLPGIGLAKACKFFMLTTNSDLNSVLKKLPSYLKMPKLEVSDEYIDLFIRAKNTFLYQLVFCPQKKCLVSLNPYPEGVIADDMEYAGKYLPDDLALELAIGNINVKTLEKFDMETSSSSVDMKKSAVWGSAKVKKVKKVEAVAFKFNSQKMKGVKRKIECLDAPESDKNAPVFEEDNELFSMYRSSNIKIEDELEEDPLYMSPDDKLNLSSSSSHVKLETESPCISSQDSKLSLKRVVKSKFFVSGSAMKSIPNVLRENSPEKLTNEDATSTASGSEFPDDIKQELPNPEVQSPVKSNKENIINRFAKKKVDAKPSSSLTSADITASLTKVERSWLDIIDSESSTITSTVSSSGMTKKMLCLDGSQESSKKKYSPESNLVKIKKSKLISTKILDFKWKKEPSSKNKPNSSLRSDGNSTFESIPDCEDDILVVLDTSISDVSSLTTNSVKNSFKSGIVKTDLCDEVVDNLPLPSSTACDSEISLSQSSSSSEKMIDSVNCKRSFNSISKPGKCRQIGLSKKSKTLDKKLSIKDTLMNFNFIRKPKNEVPVIT